MNFGGATNSNDAGGQWAYKVSKQFHWAKGKLADPTAVNAKLRLRILSGNREEYVPAPVGGPDGLPIGNNTYDIRIPLQAAFKNAVITIENGIGHYLFEHLDQNGINSVQRELLLVVGENPAKIKKIEEVVRTESGNYLASEQLALKYSQDNLFRSWADATYGVMKIPAISRQQNDAFAKKIMDEFFFAQKAFESQIQMDIIETKSSNPKFYEKYKKLIDDINPKKTEASLFVPYFREVLSSSQPE